MSCLRRSRRAASTRPGSFRLRTWKPGWFGSLSGENGLYDAPRYAALPNDLPRQVDVGRQAGLVRPLHLGDDGAGGRIDVVVDFDGRLVAGQHPLRAHAVPGVGVKRGADDRELVHDLGLQRQVLADLDAGDVGGDRLELAAEPRRGRWA